MNDWHYHANHVDGPARGSKRSAMKDARRLHVYLSLSIVDVESIRQHGIEYPMIVRCSRSDCVISREGEL